MLIEANIDALVGPTHHFGGLGIGNVASQAHAGQLSHPKQAALEGLRKATLVARLGVPQFIWLPPLRPKFDLLSNLGFKTHQTATVELKQELEQARDQAPQAFSATFSSAFMWAANAATVSPAADTSDRKTHFTPANLISSWHRAFEAAERKADLTTLFPDRTACVVHDALASISPLRDEGAANHMRLSDASGDVGFNVFVYGAEEFYGAEERQSPSGAFMPRHTRAASEAIARRHTLRPEQTFFLRQHPDAISAGVFHNDVIATSHQSLLIHHERAYLKGDAELDRLERAFCERVGQPLKRVVVSESELSLQDAVSSYLFNSQIVKPASQKDRDASSLVIICPGQCRALPAAHQCIERWLADASIPIEDAHYVDLGESMSGGGGPACLRLRVPVDAELLGTMRPNLRLNAELADQLTTLIERYYPSRLCLQDMADVEFVEHAWHAATELRRVLLDE